ncbi:unnamed protein product [Lactuca virosa]|uniref:Pentacotripeptide-repeat region of PRORP domain-containing protein n=1 Tax=Lactuca virosa TaxID=75947 RepID=A0AAU9NE57_9ASTR|nr:unnamed protein product [Lactuca virosa]
MKEYRFLPTIESCNMYMSSLLSFNRADIALPFYNQMRRSKITINVFTLNMVMNDYVQLGKLENAVQVFDEMQGKTKKAAYLVKEHAKKKLVPNSSTFSALIKAQCARKNPDRGFQLYKSMVKSNCRPNEDTVKMLILSFLQTDDYDGAFGVFKEMLERPIGPDLVVLSGLCKGFSKAWKDRLVMDLLSEVDNWCFSYERYEKVKSIICDSNNEGKELEENV